MYENRDDTILSVEDLMDALKIGRNASYKLLSEGVIPAFRIGKVWKIPSATLDEFIIISAKKKYQFLSSSI